MTSVKIPNGEEHYLKALKLEREGQTAQALFQFQMAREERNLLASLRLARIYERGELNVPIEHMVAAVYFKEAAKAADGESVLRQLYKSHPEDAAVFICIMAQACLIASESGRFSAHASSAWMWYQVVVSLGRTNLLDDADIFERLKTLLSESQLDEAEERARQFFGIAFSKTISILPAH
ncbi:MAG: hypothetical protein EKK48_29925 [Candidatus Melainabacteria bacterium]|nr:MAG: hypothetical protein EKK48_29925 [Candidatus Melainabacteria bacterium]